MNANSDMNISGEARFSFADLFAGIGGFRLAMDGIGGRCVFSSEINPEARRVYAANFGDEPAGDISLVDASGVPDHDVLCAGFPCQPFSKAGLMEGFDDPRGTLFLHIVRIAEAKRPRAIFLENVRHFSQHDGGRTLDTVLGLLEGAGYRTRWKVLDSGDFGLAQSRERTIIVGGLGGAFDFSAVEGGRRRSICDILESERDGASGEGKMRIFSKFHDYYDGVLGFGHDDSVIYRREDKYFRDEDVPAEYSAIKPDVQPLRFDTRTGKTIEVAPFVVAFCGKLYRGTFAEHNGYEPGKPPDAAFFYTYAELDGFVAARGGGNPNRGSATGSADPRAGSTLSTNTGISFPDKAPARPGSFSPSRA